MPRPRASSHWRQSLKGQREVILFTEVPVNLPDGHDLQYKLEAETSDSQDMDRKDDSVSTCWIRRTSKASAVGLVLGLIVACILYLNPLNARARGQISEKVSIDEIVLQPNSLKNCLDANRSICEWTDFGALQWALGIDGKDADKGPDAYGDAQEFATNTYQALPWVLENSREPGKCEPLSLEVIERIRYHCCRWWSWRHHNMEPVRNKGEECYHKMGCEATRDAVFDINSDLLGTTPETLGNSTCVQTAWIRKKSSDEVKETLGRILQSYNEALQRLDLAPGEGTPFEQRLEILGTFLRQLAWLHAWHNGNGRTRTLLLQRELRCLGIAPGAMMYNNNRDIFFIDNVTYVRKIREGIRMATKAIHSNLTVNPWTNKERVSMHLQEFPPPGNGTCFKCDCGWGSTE